MTYDSDELTTRELIALLTMAGLMYAVFIGLIAGGLFTLYLLLEWLT